MSSSIRTANRKGGGAVRSANRRAEAAPADVPRAVRFPASLLAVILHLIALLLLSLLLQEPRGRSAEIEPARQVGIVLATRSATPAKTAASQVEQAAESAVAEESSLAALPSLTEAALPPIELPSKNVQPPPLETSGLMNPELGKLTRPQLPTDIDVDRIRAEEAAHRLAGAPRGQAAAVQVFDSMPAIGRTFLFLVDRSKSMGSQGLGALPAVEAELMKSLGSLRPHHRFQVLAYHHQCVYLLENRLLAGTRENLQALEGHLSNLAAFGATDHLGALRTALTWEPDAVFLFTDGGEPSLTSSELKMISRRAGKATSVHCIQFGFGPQPTEDNFLARLAEDNSGSYRYVDMSP